MSLETYAVVEGGMRNLATGEFVAGEGTPPSPPLPWYGGIDSHTHSGYTTDHDGFDQLLADTVSASRPVMTFMHGYSGDQFPSTFQSSSVADAPSKGIGAMLNVKRPWAGLANGTYDSTITSFFESWPVGTFGSVTINHEPENDQPGEIGGANPSNSAYVTWMNENAPVWKAGINRFINVAAPIIRSRGLDVKVGGCLMDFSWDTTRWQWWNWWDDINPDNLDVIEFQVDAYSKTVNGSPPVGYSLEPRINTMLAEARSVGIQHFSLFETANDRRERNNGDVIVGNDESVATWWENYVPFLNAIPEVRMVCYFSIPTGPASANAYLAGRGLQVFANACLNGRRP